MTIEYLSPLHREWMATHPEERSLMITQQPFSLVTHELLQAESTGHDVTSLRTRLASLDPDDDDQLMALYSEVPLGPAAGWPWFEGSDLEAIEAALPTPRRHPVSKAEFADRVRGAWHGRVVGNMLGKPVEGQFNRPRLRTYLEGLGEYPLADYIPIPDVLFADLASAGFMAQGTVPYERLSRGRISGGIRDDDLDWTIVNLTVLEGARATFRTEDVARAWLTLMPVYQTFTAEKAAYHNLVQGVPLDEVGAYRNPYREWIGALIRADTFGYVAPGDPRRAALLAYRDAFMSHRANGIYGEMWAAALIASAFTASSPEASVRESLDHVPPRSRLAAELRAVLDARTAGMRWDEAMDQLAARHATTHWIHTINNAGALAAAILWGDGDFTATVASAVHAGLDTDSIGATAGSWAGAFLGYDAIPDHWLAPLDGRTRSAVFGFGDVRMDDLAERTLALEEQLREA